MDLAITFDDGLKSVLTNAAPILAEYDVPWSLFVVSDWADGRQGELDVLGQAGVGVVGRKLEGDGRVAGVLEQRHHPVPEPAGPTGSGQQDVVRHASGATRWQTASTLLPSGSRTKAP